MRGGARNLYLNDGGPGSLIMAAGAGVLETAANPENAEKFVRFLLSTVAQQYVAASTFEYPLVEGVKTHHLLPPLEELASPDHRLRAAERPRRLRAPSARNGRDTVTNRKPAAKQGGGAPRGAARPREWVLSPRALILSHSYLFSPSRAPAKHSTIALH